MRNKLLIIIFTCIFQMTNAATELPTALNTITVTSTNDDGSAGTLRWAITSANADPSITQIDFTSGLSGTLLLTNDLPSISTDITIIGSGSNNFTISGDNLYTMFNVDSGKTLTISHLAFTLCKAGTGSIFNTNNSNIIASHILVTGNINGSAFYSHEHSTITIENSVFNNNAGSTLFESNYGSAPETTSNVESDYTNRIKVSNSTFANNSGTIFSTERYVKIDQCTFTNNSGQIGAFYGVNRYQIVNSIFTGNTNGTLLAFGSSWIGDGTGFGELTLGANNTLVDGNTFLNNTGLLINPGGDSLYDAKTTITNNLFINNGTNWSGTPAVTTPNILNNFFTSVSHVSANNTVIVTMSRPVFNTNLVTGSLEITDFQFSLSGGTATLGSATPTSISNVGNVYTLGINISGTVDGTETLTVNPVSNSIFDASTNIANSSQANNTATLNLPDDDSDGVPNSLDSCPGTLPGVVVDPDGCEDITPPTTPVGITSYAGNFNVTMNWTANSDDAIGYKIYGGTDQNNLSLLSTTANTNYVHTGLSITTTYYYTIVAYDLAGNNSTASAVINETTTNPIIWNATPITFQKLNYANYQLTQNQDHLTNNVIITRANSQGFFNIATESSSGGNPSSSPIDTEWALGSLADIANLNFQSWGDNINWNPLDQINNTYVVHLITDNIYLELTVLSWTPNNAGGGFSYTRTSTSCSPPSAPTASSQNFSSSATVADLVASGTAIQWYSSTAVGSPLLSSTTTLATGTYYASQTVNSCESYRTSVAVTVVNCNQSTSTNSKKLANGSTYVTTLSAQSNWAISGGANQGLFSITNNNVLSFSSAANYDNNSSNSYLVNVTNGCLTINYSISISPLCGTWELQGGDGLTQSNPGKSAYQIKRDYPNSADGLYWISNPNINNNTPFQIYADMTTNGGGWTLIMCNNDNTGWDGSNAILRNENNPSINGQYSIISYADYIKKSASGFQYMLEATTRGAWGGIWTANQAYSFVHTTNDQTNVTMNTRFSNWWDSDDGIEQRMPWYYSSGPGVITTSADPGISWWGTLVSLQGFSPAPWLGCCGNDNPQIIWYWVR
jgi:hypothetical protein